MPKKKITTQYKILKEGVVIAGFFFALLLSIMLLSYSPADINLPYSSGESDIQNLAGRLGALIAAYLYYWLGYASYLLLLFLVLGSVNTMHAAQTLNNREEYGVYISLIRRLSAVLLLLSVAAILSLQYPLAQNLPASGGGLIGIQIADKLIGLLGVFVANLVLIFLIAVSLSLYTGLSWFQILEVLGGAVLVIAAKFKLIKSIRLPLIPVRKATHILASLSQSKVVSIKSSDGSVKKTEPKFVFIPGHSSIKETDRVESAALAKEEQERKNREEYQKQQTKPDPPKILGRPSEQNVYSNAENSKLLISEQDQSNQKSVVKTESHTQDSPQKNNDSQYMLPEVDLLSPPLHTEEYLQKNDLGSMGRLIVKTLKDFGISAKLLGASPGPVVTMFELEPAAGVKASKISNLAGDLARSLAVGNVRVVEFISGKSCIGIEVPNPMRKNVYLNSLIDSKEFNAPSLQLPVALGQDIAGKTIIADLADMPHLLVAGTTGSGKSIGINAMLLSLLYKYSPNQLRLILVDPKMLELSSYNGIPHLLTPVITDMNKAAKSIGWCVNQMEERYKLMAQKGARNIESYNKQVSKKASDSLPSNINKSQTLPYLVVIIDEYADMIMSNRKVEDHIVRLAQKARAAGVHLILATQRPSVDVITGLIKANIPARISFKVSSRIDSRTILDQNGAEQLLGKGDMLYMYSGGALPLRVHGALVIDKDVNNVTEYWKQQGSPQYQEEVLQAVAAGEKLGTVTNQDDIEEDELYSAAVDFVKTAQRVSISSVQRKFKVGYNRAARIIEQMESNKIVSEMDSAGKRVVLE